MPCLQLASDPKQQLVYVCHPTCNQWECRKRSHEKTRKKAGKHLDSGVEWLRWQRNWRRFDVRACSLAKAKTIQTYSNRVQFREHHSTLDMSKILCMSPRPGRLLGKGLMRFQQRLHVALSGILISWMYSEHIETIAVPGILVECCRDSVKTHQKMAAHNHQIHQSKKELPHRIICSLPMKALLLCTSFEKLEPRQRYKDTVSQHVRAFLDTDPSRCRIRVSRMMRMLKLWKMILSRHETDEPTLERKNSGDSKKRIQELPSHTPTHCICMQICGNLWGMHSIAPAFSCSLQNWIYVVDSVYLLFKVYVCLCPIFPMFLSYCVLCLREEPGYSTGHLGVFCSEDFRANSMDPETLESW